LALATACGTGIGIALLDIKVSDRAMIRSEIGINSGGLMDRNIGLPKVRVQ